MFKSRYLVDLRIPLVFLYVRRIYQNALQGDYRILKRYRESINSPLIEFVVCREAVDPLAKKKWRAAKLTLP